MSVEPNVNIQLRNNEKILEVKYLAWVAALMRAWDNGWKPGKFLMPLDMYRAIPSDIYHALPSYIYDGLTFYTYDGVSVESEHAALLADALQKTADTCPDPEQSLYFVSHVPGFVILRGKRRRQDIGQPNGFLVSVGCSIKDLQDLICFMRSGGFSIHMDDKAVDRELESIAGDEIV